MTRRRRRELRCPGCGHVIVATHHCRANGLRQSQPDHDQATPMPLDFRSRIKPEPTQLSLLEEDQ